MATPSSILAWRTPWTEEPHGLSSSGSQSDATAEWLTLALFRPSRGSHLVQNGSKGFPVAQKAPPKQAPGASWALSRHLASSLSPLGCCPTILPAAPRTNRARPALRALAPAVLRARSALPLETPSAHSLPLSDLTALLKRATLRPTHFFICTHHQLVCFCRKRSI